MGSSLCAHGDRSMDILLVLGIGLAMGAVGIVAAIVMLDSLMLLVIATGSYSTYKIASS